MTYAHRPAVYDADSHLMEGLDWLRDHADPSVREQLPDLSKLLGSAGAGADQAIRAGQERIGDAAAVARLEADVIASAKGWMALGAMDRDERTRALDLLGFQSQLVFSTFSVGLFAFADDLEVVYGGATAHNRMVGSFCAEDERLVGVGFLPLNDPERSLVALEEALELGCGAMWVAHAATGGRSPAHVDNDPVWAAIAEADVPVVLHIGGGRTAISKAWHRNGRPKPPDLHGGGENLRAKDLPAVHHNAEVFLGCLILDGVFERFPALRCGVIEMGASWVSSLMARLDYAHRSFRKTEPMLAELTLKPSEYLRRQVRVTPYPGEDVAAIVQAAGPEMFLFSSDYPHPEGTKDPIGSFERSFADADLGEAVKQRFYEDNYRQLLSL